MSNSTDNITRLVQSLPQDPYLDSGMRGFILNTARKNYWRVAGLCDLADLVQDGIMLYYKCYGRYVKPRTDLTGSADERRWFQSLVKTSYLNHISTLASKHRGVTERPVSAFLSGEIETSDFVERNLPAQQELGTLAASLAQAPWELLELLRLLAGDGADALRFMRRKVGRRSIRETTNERYCRLIGVDPNERDLIGELRTHFG